MFLSLPMNFEFLAFQNKALYMTISYVLTKEIQSSIQSFQTPAQLKSHLIPYSN